MTTLKSTLIAAGHVIASDAPITDATLAPTRMFVIGEPQQELSDAAARSLATYIRNGGVLVLLADVGANPTFYNAILSGVGSSISIAGNAGNAPLVAGNYASQGPPYDLVGRTLAVTAGSGVVGGVALAGSYVHYESIGQGNVFVFGDRLDHNALAPNAATVNGQLFLNLAARSALPPVAGDSVVSAIPASSPWSLLVLVASLAILGAWRTRTAT